MLLHVLFWLMVAIDAAVIGFILVMGMAAAGPSHTSPVAVIGFVMMPALILAGCIAVYLMSHSMGWRVAAFLLAASPLLLAFGGRGFAEWKTRGLMNADGTWNSFQTGPMRELEVAIRRHDVAGVAAAARKAKVNQEGMAGVTPLLLAIGELEKMPTELGSVRALLAAGADPKATNGEVLPLVAAIRVSRHAGTAPVRLLLEAGAQPNQRDTYGQPAYFSGGNGATDPDVMKLMLDAGADLQATDGKGRGALAYAMDTGNWPVMALLLERGADWRQVKTRDGQSLLAHLEHGNHFGDDTGRADVIRLLKAAGAR